MLTMMHTNLARTEGDVLFIDRKFHTGMQEYLRNLDMPILSLHPRLSPEKDRTVMDLVELPIRELGYQVLTLPVDKHEHVSASDEPILLDALRKSRLLYGNSFDARRLSRQVGVPVVGIMEYNLRTTLVFAAAGVQNLRQRTIRQAGAFKYYMTRVAPLMKSATMLHCNGYPIFEEARWLNANRLLYLDSRMRGDMVIPLDRLEARLAERRSRRPRLLFSGRLEPAKGALDVVHVAAECHRRGLDFELELYGQGSQREEITRTIASEGLSSKVFLRDPVPYPTLNELARSFDLFVCCHIQDDPSCTYLESLGCGLPVVGYSNGMWRAMFADCRAGLVRPLGSPEKLAEAIIELLAEPEKVDDLSRRARTFALDHSFEREYRRRTDSIQTLYRESSQRRSA